MRALLIKIINRFLSVFTVPLTNEQLAQIVFKLITRHVDRLSPLNGLQFLFRLDALLYQLQTRIAVNYENGLHPKHRLMNYHNFFIARITKEEKVLDIGCGNGAVAYDVAKHTGAVVLGIDISKENIKKAKEKYQHPNLEFREGDALVELPNQMFSLVILSNVLEHLPKRAVFLRRVKDTIQPSRFLIRVPLFERDWRVPLKKEVGIEWRLDETHETEYTLESFSAETAEAGLEIKHLEVRWGEIWSELIPTRS